MSKLILAISVFFVSTYSYSASFDCSKASSSVEKAICSDSELSTLDEKLDEVYKTALQANPSIKTSQRDWLKSLNTCDTRSLPECLKPAFKSRIQVLNFISNTNRGIVGLEIKGLIQSNGRVLLEIGSVLANSPAQEAGINPGELISEINGKSFTDIGQVFEALNVPPGKSLSFKLMRRDNSELMVQLKVASRPGQEVEVKASEAIQEPIKNTDDKNIEKITEQNSPSVTPSNVKNDHSTNKESGSSGSNLFIALVTLLLAGAGGFFLIRKKKLKSTANEQELKKSTFKPAPISPEEASDDPIYSLHKKGILLYNSGDLKRATHILQEAANQGYADSQYFLGKIMIELSENTTDQYFESGLAWMRKAAKLKQKDAISFLSDMDEVNDAHELTETYSSMPFDDWDKKISRQGVELDQVAEHFGISLDIIEKWRAFGKAPQRAVDFLRELQAETQDVVAHAKKESRKSISTDLNTHDYLCTDCGWHGFSDEAKFDEEYEGNICPDCGGGDLDLGTFPVHEDLYSTAQCGHCEWVGSPDDCSRNESDELICPSCSAEDDISLSKQPIAGWFGDNRDLILRALTTHGSWLKDIPESLANDKELVMAAVNSPYTALKYASADLRNDIEVVRAAIGKSAFEFEFASDELQDNKDIALEAVSSSGYVLEYASDRLKNDKTIVLTAVSESGSSLQHASKKLQSEREIVLAAVSSDGSALEYASEKCQEDEEIVLAALNQDGNSIRFAATKFKASKKIAIKAVTNNGSAFEYLSENLRADRDLASIALSSDGSQYQNMSDELKADEELAKIAVKDSGWVLEYLIEDFQSNKEIVLLAVSNYGAALEFASKELKTDSEVVNQAIESNQDAGHYSLLLDSHSKSWRITPNDENTALDIYIYKKDDQVITVTRRWREFVAILNSDRRPLIDLSGFQDVYQFAKENNIEIENLDYHDGQEAYLFENMSKKDEQHWRDFILNNDYAMLDNQGWTLIEEKLIFESTVSIEECEKTGESITNDEGSDWPFISEDENSSADKIADRKLMLSMVQEEGYELDNASEDLQADKEIVLLAVKNAGLALQFASLELRNNKEVVTAAIENNPWAYEYAGPDILNDFDITLKVVKSEGYLIQYASEELRNDRTIVEAAVSNDSGSIAYVSDDFNDDKDIALIAMQNNGAAISDLSERLQIDEDIVRIAIETYPSAIQNADGKFLGDKNLVISALRKDGSLLEYVADQLKQDVEVVTAAASNDVLVLKNSSESISSNPDFVLKLMQSNCIYLQFASPSIQENSSFIELAKSNILERMRVNGDLIDVYSDEWLSKQDEGSPLNIQICGEFDAKFGTTYRGHLKIAYLYGRIEEAFELATAFPELKQQIKKGTHRPNFLFMNTALDKILCVGLGRKNRIFIIDSESNKSIDVFGVPGNPNSDKTYISKFAELDYGNVIKTIVHTLDEASTLMDEQSTFEDYDSQEYEDVCDRLYDVVRKIQFFFPQCEAGDLNTGDY